MGYTGENGDKRKPVERWEAEHEASGTSEAPKRLNAMASGLMLHLSPTRLFQTGLRDTCRLH